MPDSTAFPSVVEAVPPARPPLRLAAALRQSLGAGYGRGDLRADLLAGAVVGVVALPLSMALAVASGVPPQHGLYTAIVAGGLIALLGGSHVQVSGPTAAFVVLLAPISAQFGVGGLLLATLMAGLLLIALGAARLGGLIQFVPYPVTTGFTAGIAVVIATLQLRDLLGLSVATMPDHYVERLGALVAALPTARWQDGAVGAFTLALLLLWPRVTRRVPAPLVALAVATLAAFALSTWVPGFSVETIASRFGGIPQLPPLPVLPWHLPGADGQALELSWGLLRTLAPSAFAIALLGAIESLLSAVVADGMTGHTHDPDAELVAQGLGNVLAPFFGGIAATGALARTATNVRSGARSPLAGVFHALVVLAAILVLAPALGYLPMASLGALLLVVAWNMSEARHFVHALKVAPKSDSFLLLTCFGLTVFFDMVVSVTVGVLLAALLFMRRMAEVSGVALAGSEHPIHAEGLPREVMVYEVAGPLFFGAAQKAMSALARVPTGIKVVILDLSAVPAIDSTGLVSLEAAIDKLRGLGIFVVLAGVQSQPLRVLAKAGLPDRREHVAVYRTFERAAAAARDKTRSRTGRQGVAAAGE